MSKILEPGTEAPDFSLPVTADQKLSLKELRGKPVVLAFYPADWSPVCSDEMSIFNTILSELREQHKAQIIGISVDSAWCHTAFSKNKNIHFPLLADFEPKGAVARKYGAYDEKTGYCQRAIFVIDKNGKIAWSYLSPLAENPGVDGVLEALENLKKNNYEFKNTAKSKRA